MGGESRSRGHLALSGEAGHVRERHVTAPRRRPSRSEPPAPSSHTRLANHCRSSPGDIAFLLAHGVPETVLQSATRVAELRGTGARQELFFAGYNQELYWRLLAQDLGLVFSDHLRACMLDPDQHLPDGDLPRAPTRLVVRRGSVRLLVLAPDARQIALLRNALARAPALAQSILIAAPQTMQALVLRERQHLYARSAVGQLAQRFPRLSAGRLAAGRKDGPFVLSAAALVVALVYPADVVYAASWLLALIFLNSIVWKGAAAFHTPRPSRHEAVASRLLPTYSVLVPLRREAAVLPDLVKHLGALDYPAFGSKRTKHIAAS